MSADGEETEIGGSISEVGQRGLTLTDSIDMFQEERGSGGIQVGNLWLEMKEWRRHWKLSRFFNVLILGLAASLADSGTDFNFVWSVPEACGNATECSLQEFDLDRVSSPCGMFHYKKVERASYLFIALPGFFLGFAGLQRLVGGLTRRWWKGEVDGIIRRIAGAFAVALEFSLFAGLFLGAIGIDNWPCARPHLAPVYD